MAKKNYLLQILRAVLFFMIFIYHCELPGTSFFWCGIEVFFCISGYFIFKKLFEMQPRRSYVFQLAYNRIKRLCLPNYLSIITVCGIFVFLIKKIDFIRFLSFVFCLQNITWLVMGLDSFALMAHSWTIAIEVQTIIIICAIVLVIQGLKAEKKLIIPLMMVISLIYVGMVPYLLKSNIVYSLCPISHFFSFALGGFVYLCQSKKLDLKKTGAVMIAFGTTGIVGLSFYIGNINNTGVITALLSMNSATVNVLLGRPIAFVYSFISLIGGGFLCLCLNWCEITMGKIGNLLVYVGDNSFVLYLLHYPIVYILFKVINNIYIASLFALIITFVLLDVSNFVAEYGKKVKGLIPFNSNFTK